MMIEQPLAHDDIFDHAVLANRLRTPICLDESIHGLDDARHAVESGACRIINVKPGRVGGTLESRRIAAWCQSRGVPVWCGGMLETGIGRAHNVAIAALPGFVLPGDTSDSRRYFHDDVTEPRVTMQPDGTIALPQGPGLGFEPHEPSLDRFTHATEWFGNSRVWAIKTDTQITCRAVEADEYEQCLRLQFDTWGPSFAEPVPYSVFALLRQISGLVLGAFDDADRLLGFALSFPGLVDGTPVQWSDMLAVHPHWRDRHIGMRLKQAQRDESLRRGFKTIMWTFDPLESRNAWFNFRKLGVTSHRYEPNFYGVQQCALLRGLDTDRLVVRWDLEEPSASLLPAAWDEVAGSLGTAAALLANGAGPAPARLDVAGFDVLIEIPHDVQSLKQSDMPTAQRWRAATREVFTHYLAAGYRVLDYCRYDTPGGARGFYLMRR
jgi:predicted GNAT superfamily acetyltransferase